MFHHLGILQSVNIAGRLTNNVVPRQVGQSHVFFDEMVLFAPVRLGADHVAHRLVESVDLLGLEVAYDGDDGAQNLLYEGHHLPHLHLNELFFAFLRYFDEGVASHVLHTIVSFVHKLKQLIDNSFQETPVNTKESEIITFEIIS